MFDFLFFVKKVLMLMVIFNVCVICKISISGYRLGFLFWKFKIYEIYFKLLMLGFG